MQISTPLECQLTKEDMCYKVHNSFPSSNRQNEESYTEVKEMQCKEIIGQQTAFQEVDLSEIMNVIWPPDKKNVNSRKLQNTKVMRKAEIIFISKRRLQNNKISLAVLLTGNRICRPMSSD
jgi:hypothetical protein